MSQPRYENATVVICDPVAQNRNATRNALYALGFRDIESCVSAADLRRVLSAKEFDLVFAEVADINDPAFAAVADIRRNALGRNPFTVVILSTWSPGSALVRASLDCGADDLLIRPASTAMMGERIRTHTLARKKFVVTGEYIGPDRRKDPGRENSAELFDVANTLNLRAVKGLSGLEAQAAIQAAVNESLESVNLERMRRSAFQIGIIAGFLRDSLGLQGEEPARKADLRRAGMIAEDLLRMSETQNLQQAQRTCETLISVVNGGLNGEDLGKTAKLLSQLSVALQVIYTPGRRPEECESELENTLVRIRTRGRAG